MAGTAFRTKPRAFVQTLKSKAMVYGTSIAIAAFAAYTPKLEAAEPQVGSKNGAEVNPMGPRTKVETEVSTEAMKKFTDLEGQVNGWRMFAYTEEEKSNRIKTMANDKAFVAKGPELYALGVIVQKILDGESYKDEAKALNLTITPQMEKEIKVKFKNLETPLGTYMAAIMKVSDTYESRDLTGEVKGGVSMAQRSISFPETQFFHIYENTWRSVLTTGMPEPGWDLIGNFQKQLPREATPDQRQAELAAATDLAKQFCTGTMNVFQSAIKYNWDIEAMKKDPAALKAMSDLADLLGNVTRLELKSDPLFKPMQDGLRNGDPSAFRDFMSSSTVLGNAVKEILSNMITVDVDPMAINVTTIKGKVIWQYPGKERAGGGIEGGMGEFQQFLENNNGYMSPTVLGVFVEGARSLQNLVAVKTRFSGIGTADPKTIVQRLSGTGESASIGGGGIVGYGAFGQPMVITAMMDYRKDDVTIPLKETLTLPSGQGIDTIRQSRSYLGVVSMDIWFPGKNNTLIRIISPHVGVKHYGSGDWSKNYLFYAQAGFDLHRGEHTVRFDVSQNVFWLAQNVSTLTNQAIAEQKGKWSHGTTASIKYMKDRIGKRISSWGGGVVGDYTWTKYEGAMRHVVSVSVPLEIVVGNRKRLSVSLAPGMMWMREGSVSDSSKTLMLNASFEF